MVLRPEAVPVEQPAKKVPVALKEPLLSELTGMEKACIIVKEEEPTEWVSPLVALRKKDGSHVWTPEK